MRVLVSLVAFTLGLFFAVVPAYTHHQDQKPQAENRFRIRLETPAVWSRWDDPRNELITAAADIRPVGPATPLVSIYNAVSGEKRSISIPKEFSKARYVYVDAIAVGSEGSVLVACEVSLDDRAFVGERLLSFDGQSTLTANLVAADYDVGAVALDKHGNVYAVGTHNGELPSGESYSLVVRYDSYGHITLETLPRSLFSTVEDPIGDGVGGIKTGATRLAVDETAIEVYLAPVSEMIVMNQVGEIQTRVNVASRLAEFAKTKGYKSFFVEADEFSPSGDLWFVGRLVDAQDNQRPARNFVVRLTATGLFQVPYKSVGDEPRGHYLPQLIGFTQSDEPVGSSSEESGYLLVQKRPY
jgi:hypothetical protein